jgi:hypothetical protein
MLNKRAIVESLLAFDYESEIDCFGSCFTGFGLDGKIL